MSTGMTSIGSNYSLNTIWHIYNLLKRFLSYLFPFFQNHCPVPLLVLRPWIAYIEVAFERVPDILDWVEISGIWRGYCKGNLVRISLCLSQFSPMGRSSVVHLPGFPNTKRAKL